MSTERSNAGSGNLPVHIARTPKKCIGYSKMKVKDCSIFDGNLICSKWDDKAKRAEEIWRSRPGQETRENACSQTSKNINR